MKKMGGNITAIVQKKTTSKSRAGEAEKTWTDYKTLTGWLDLLTATKDNTLYAFIKNSTHVFMFDYANIGDATEKNARVVIDGEIYNIEYIDNPQQRNYHIEIYLRKLDL